MYLLNVLKMLYYFNTWYFGLHANPPLCMILGLYTTQCTLMALGKFQQCYYKAVFIHLLHLIYLYDTLMIFDFENSPCMLTFLHFWQTCSGFSILELFDCFTKKKRGKFQAKNVLSQL